MMLGRGSVPSSSIFSCLGCLPPPLSSNDARSGFYTILLHLLLSWASPSSLAQLWCQVGVLYHPPPSSPVLGVSLLPCPAMMPGQGSVPSSSIFPCPGCLPPPLSSYDARSGFYTILLHLPLSWVSPSSLVQLWCQVRVLCHPPPSSPVLGVSLLPCPAMMPGLGSIPSSSIFSCLGLLPPPLSSYDARSGFCAILLHLLLCWPSPSSEPHLFMSHLMLSIHLILGLPLASVPLTSIFNVFSSGFSHNLGSPQSFWIALLDFVQSNTPSTFNPHRFTWFSSPIDRMWPYRRELAFFQRDVFHSKINYFDGW